jgi:single-strand DNA-binding protein
MNTVCISGRLTKDPDVRYTSQQTAIARFTVAVSRGKKDGEDQTDYPSVVCFGKTAEIVEKYLGKGRMVGITGRLQTGSYTNKDGQKVYTTDVVAERVDFFDKAADKSDSKESADPTHDGFNKIDDDSIPF